MAEQGGVSRVYADVRLMWLHASTLDVSRAHQAVGGIGVLPLYRDGRSKRCDKHAAVIVALPKITCRVRDCGPTETGSTATWHSS